MKRDSKVRDLLVLRGGKYIAGADLTIQAPEVYTKHGLLQLGDKIFCIGHMAIISGDKYAVFNMLSLIPLTPSSVSIVSIDGDKYYEFSFKKGDTVIPTTKLIQRAGVIYDVMNIFMFYSNQPWYMTPLDLYKLLTSASYYANMNTDSNPEIISLYITLVSRTARDGNLFYKNGKPSDKLRWVSLSDVKYIKSTFAKITNNYQSAGLQSALIAEPNQPSSIEKIARA